jgi:hypothetical protein
MHSRLATCIALVVGFALLGIPAQPPAQGNQNQLRIAAFGPEQTSSRLQQVAFGGFASAASCNYIGYPCGFRGYPCCPGLICKFWGGSTRVGYQCRPASGNASTGSFWERLSATKLD